MNISEEKKLLEQLDFAKAQEMIEDEEEIISQLILLNPANQSYRDLKKDLDEKKVLLVINEYKKTEKFKKKEPAHFKPNLMSQYWENKILEMSKNKPSHTKELSLFLYFCNNVKLAVDLLENHITQIEDYWYYIDWTLETKQFSKGLSVISYIESSKDFYHFDSVELLYKKAQFLYGLGKEDKAIEYLHSIIQFYPDYKNINDLLSKWSKSASLK